MRVGIPTPVRARSYDGGPGKAAHVHLERRHEVEYLRAVALLESRRVRAIGDVAVAAD